MLKTLTFGSPLTRCTIPCACHAKAHLSVQKWSVRGVFCMTSKFASRHHGMDFFDISTSKSGPNLVSFVHFWLRNVLRVTTACDFFDVAASKSGPSMVSFIHFDLEMCFVPQRPALFRHLNFQKWSEPAWCLCTFWLRNVLRVTTACTFSTAQLPKVVRSWCALRILTSKCGSRHNSVQFFISHLARWLRTRRFSEPTFRPSGATNHWKNTVFRDFPTFSRACIFFLLTLSLLYLLSSTLLFSLTLPISAFHLSILSEVWLLNFLRINSDFMLLSSQCPGT